MNDYSMFEIVFSEKFMVSNIGLLFKIPFWKARRFDGSELWDGSHLMDAAIEYEMRLGVKYKEGEFRIAETLDIERMTARAKVPLSEKMHIEKQTVCNGKRTHRLNDNNSTRNNQRIMATFDRQFHRFLIA